MDVLMLLYESGARLSFQPTQYIELGGVMLVF